MRGQWLSTSLILGVVGALGLASACSTSGGGSDGNTAESESASSSGGNGGTSTGSAAASGQDNCSRTNDACECENGGRGLYSCHDGENVCNCDACEQLAPETFAFDACGGEPLGTWILSSTETFGAHVFVSNELTGHTDFCPAQLKFDDVDAFDYRLAFSDSGEVEVYTSAYSTTYWYDEACVEEGLYTSCEATDWDLFECTGQACGLCSCPVSWPESSWTGTWTQSDSALSISTATGESTDYDYCVDGDRMQLLAEGISLVFARAYTFSRPLPCADREPEACTGGCALDGDTETCSGSPDACALGDYGNVLGCEWVDAAEPNCAGERERCQDQALESCEDLYGCEVASACVGGAVACDALSGACGFCADVTGCTPCSDRDAPCIGSTTCEAQPRQSDCESATEYGMGDCEWLDETCVGELIPCEELTPEECAGAPGCMLD